jgi:hypothetical protein
MTLIEGSQRAPHEERSGTTFLRGQGYLMQVPKRIASLVPSLTPSRRSMPPLQKDPSSHRNHRSYFTRTTSPGRSSKDLSLSRATGITFSSFQGHLEGTISSERSVPPHWTTSVPSPGRQDHLTRAAGASPISPTRSILHPRESSAPCAASVACSFRLRQAADSVAAGLRATSTSCRRLAGSVLLSQRGAPAPAPAPACAAAPPAGPARPGFLARWERGVEPSSSASLELFFFPFFF